MNLLPVLSSFPSVYFSRYYCTALSTACWYSTLLLHSVWNPPWHLLRAAALDGSPDLRKICHTHRWKCNHAPPGPKRAWKGLARVMWMIHTEYIWFISLIWANTFSFFFYLNHKASTISVPVAASLPLVPVTPQQTQLQLIYNIIHTLNPFHASFSFLFQTLLDALGLKVTHLPSRLRDTELTQCQN